MRLIACHYVMCHLTTAHQYAKHRISRVGLPRGVEFPVRGETKQQQHQATHQQLALPRNMLPVMRVCFLRSIRELLRICAEKEKVSYTLKVWRWLWCGALEIKNFGEINIYTSPKFKKTSSQHCMFLIFRFQCWRFIMTVWTTFWPKAPALLWTSESRGNQYLSQDWPRSRSRPRPTSSTSWRWAKRTERSPRPRWTRRGAALRLTLNYNW